MSGSTLAFGLASLTTVAMAWVLRRRRGPVTAAEIASTLPWFAVVGVVVAIGRSVPASGLAAGLLRSPTVYLVLGTVLAGVWLVLDAAAVAETAPWTALSGALATVAVGGASFRLAEALAWRVLAWNAVAVVLAIGIAGLVLGALQQRGRSPHGWLGAGVVFGHVLDATTTGVGLERLGATERNPVSAAIIRAGDGVGPSGVVGFLLAKTAVAVLVLLALDPNDDLDRETAGLLVVAAGVGLVPAVHNLTLFALTVH
jgi:uncharacterized membrane protein